MDAIGEEGRGDGVALKARILSAIESELNRCFAIDEGVFVEAFAEAKIHFFALPLFLASRASST